MEKILKQMLKYPYWISAITIIISASFFFKND